MGKRNKVTTRDIAEYLGVSQSTVSMVLSQNPKVSFTKETVQKVEEAAKKLGYKKPEKSLPKKEKNLAKTIVVICPTFSNAYYTLVLQSITERAKEYGYTVFTISSGRDLKQEEAYLKLLSGFTLAGIIFVYSPEKLSIIHSLAKLAPFVLIGDKPASCHLDAVELDSWKTGYILGNHLLDFGHRDIAFVTFRLRANTINRTLRLEGLRQSFKDRQLSPERIQVISPTKSDFRACRAESREYDIGYLLAKHLLKEERKVTAFVGNNDTIAYGIMAAISDMGYKIPNDYSVCGFDNLPMSSMPQISLTTVEHVARQKGQEAVDIIFRKNQQKEGDKHPSYIMRMEYTPELIVRNSTRKL